MTKRIFHICLAVFCAVFLAYFIAACFLATPFNFLREERRAYFDIVKSVKKEIYIGGAVEREGYYSYGGDDTYLDLLAQAGVHPKGAIDYALGDRVSSSLTILIVNYIGADGLPLSINANSSFAEFFALKAGVPPEAVNKIISYRNTNGFFQNKGQLIDLFGEEYSAFIPYFYIGEGDK